MKSTAVAGPAAGLAFGLALSFAAAPALAQDTFSETLARIIKTLVAEGAGDMANLAEDKQTVLVTCMATAMAGIPQELKVSVIAQTDAVTALTLLQNSVDEATDEAVEDCFEAAFQ